MRKILHSANEGKKYVLMIFSAILMLGFSQQSWGQISYTTPGSSYTQTFDNLYTTVPANNTVEAATILPAGWIFTEAGTNSNTTFRNDNGSSGTGDTYLDGPLDLTKELLELMHPEV